MQVIRAVSAILLATGNWIIYLFRVILVAIMRKVHAGVSRFLLHKRALIKNNCALEN